VSVWRTVTIGLAILCFAPEVHAATKKRPVCDYTVKKGDTVSRIAKRVGVTEDALVRANPAIRKNPHRLRVGQSLQICKARDVQATTPQKCAEGGRVIVHKVGKGETVGAIAARYSVSRDSVRRYNKQLKKRNNDMIRVGEQLRVCTTNRKFTHRSWLKEGVQLPFGDGYNVRRPANAWGTPHAVAGITAAVARYRQIEPDAPLVQIGDISRENGGPLREHVSHQEGRDVDIGVVFEPEPADGSRKIDIARTWSLLRSFVEDDAVSVIFIDYKLQKRLYEHAQEQGVDQPFLDRVFEYPRSGDEEAILYHWRGHTTHFHVRFKERAPKPSPEDFDDVFAAPRYES
jgi:LysM repeat protein